MALWSHVKVDPCPTMAPTFRGHAGNLVCHDIPAFRPTGHPRLRHWWPDNLLLQSVSLPALFSLKVATLTCGKKIQPGRRTRRGGRPSIHPSRTWLKAIRIRLMGSGGGLKAREERLPVNADAARSSDGVLDLIPDEARKSLQRVSGLAS